MSEKEIHTLMEVQYLLGRLDELHKAFPTITSMERSRKIDLRIAKYYDKLKNTSEIAYHIYIVQKETTLLSQNKSKLRMKELLKCTLAHIDSKELKKEVTDQINSYI